MVGIEPGSKFNLWIRVTHNTNTNLCFQQILFRFLVEYKLNLTPIADWNHLLVIASKSTNYQKQLCKELSRVKCIGRWLKIVYKDTRFILPIQKLNEKSRDCHNYNPQPTPDTKRKKKDIKQRMHDNRLSLSKRGDHNDKQDWIDSRTRSKARLNVKHHVVTNTKLHLGTVAIINYPGI